MARTSGHPTCPHVTRIAVWPCGPCERVREGRSRSQRRRGVLDCTHPHRVPARTGGATPRHSCRQTGLLVCCSAGETPISYCAWCLDKSLSCEIPNIVPVKNTTAGWGCGAIAGKGRVQAAPRSSLPSAFKTYHARSRGAQHSQIAKRPFFLAPLPDTATQCHSVPKGR